jgi:hypothetical protein
LYKEAAYGKQHPQLIIGIYNCLSLLNTVYLQDLVGPSQGGKVGQSMYVYAAVLVTLWVPNAAEGDKNHACVQNRTPHFLWRPLSEDSFGSIPASTAARSG